MVTMGAMVMLALLVLGVLAFSSRGAALKVYWNVPTEQVSYAPVLEGMGCMPFIIAHGLKSIESSNQSDT